MKTVEVSNERTSFRKLAALMDDDHVETFALSNVVVEGSEDDMIRLGKMVRGHPSLREFSCTNVSCTEASMDHIISMSLVAAQTMQVLRLHKTPITKATMTTIKYCSSLKVLDMSDCGLTDEDAFTIADAVSENFSITDVDLSENFFSDESSSAFELCLDKNPSVTSLQLKGNKGLSSGTSREIDRKLASRPPCAASLSSSLI